MSTSKQGGDDLDDDFVPDDLVALSEPEDDAGEDLQSDDGVQGLLSADEDDAERETIDAAAVEKKRKRREKEKERKAKVFVVRFSPRRCYTFRAPRVFTHCNPCFRRRGN